MSDYKFETEGKIVECLSPLIKKEHVESFHYISPHVQNRGLNILDIYNLYEVHIFSRNKYTTDTQSINLVVFMEETEDEEGTLEKACMDMLTEIDSNKNYDNEVTYDNPHRFYHCTCSTKTGTSFHTCELLPFEST